MRYEKRGSKLWVLTMVLSSFMFSRCYAVLLYLYRARNKITQLSIPTQAQLQRHRLKFI
jgi:hypothetical protein